MMKCGKDEKHVLGETAKLVRKKVVSNFFVEFSRFHRKWLTELTMAYKAKGRFPVVPCSVLPQYYSDRKDMEVAAVMALLIKDDSKSMTHVREFRKMMGEHPATWLYERRFISFSFGDVAWHCTGGVKNWRIAKFADLLYDIKDIASQKELLRTPIVEVFGAEAGEKLRTLFLVMCTEDGVGLGLWQHELTGLKCPLRKDVLKFLELWLPDYRKYMDADEAIGLFDFEWDSDFFYACMAWKDLCRRKPLECSRYSKRYYCNYNLGRLMKPHLWAEMINTLRDEV